MGKYKTNTCNNNCINFSLEMIHNPNSINIFSDASMRPRGNKENRIMDGCYGSIVLYMDDIIEEQFRMNSNCTVPAAEMRGIRQSLDLALRYRHMVPVINIFSDSQICIFTLRDYFYNWIYDYNTNMYYSKTTMKDGVPVKNQNLIVECMMMLEELRRTNIVNLYHQKGHIGNSVEELRSAIETFKNSNGIRGKIDYSLARYISTYNNYVDNKSRSILRRTNMRENTFRDPITFHPRGNTELIYQNQI